MYSSQPLQLGTVKVDSTYIITGSKLGLPTGLRNQLHSVLCWLSGYLCPSKGKSHAYARHFMAKSCSLYDVEMMQTADCCFPTFQCSRGSFLFALGTQFRKPLWLPACYVVTKIYKTLKAFHWSSKDVGTQDFPRLLGTMLCLLVFVWQPCKGWCGFKWVMEP